MAAPVVVNFKVGGVADVLNAFRTVAKATEQAERQLAVNAQRSVRVTERATKAQQDAHVKVFREQQKILAKQAAEQEKAAKVAERTAKRAADAVARDQEQALRRELRAREDAERQKQRVMMNSAAMAGRYARQAADAEVREQKRANEARSRFGRSIGSNLANAAGRTLGIIGRIGGAALALGGGFSAVDSVRERLANDKVYQQLVNSSAGATSADGSVRGRMSIGDLRGRVRGTALASGFDESELLTGLVNYQAMSNDIEGGLKNLPELAKLAKGSGANFGEMMQALGEIRSQNENLSSDDAIKMMMNIVAQGKLGSVELRDMASIAGKATATSGAYGGAQADVQAKLLALTQLARKTSGSPEEAATTVSRLSSDAMKHRDKLAKGGVKGVFDQDGNITSPEALITKVMGASKGNLGKIMDLGFGERSIRLFQALAPVYRAAEKLKAGTGTEAVAREVGRFTEARYRPDEANRDFQEVMGTDAEKLDQAFRDLKDQLGTELIPVVRDLIPKFKEIIPNIVGMIDAIAKFVSWFASSPLAAGGALMGGMVAKDMAGAGAGALLRGGAAAAFRTGGALLAGEGVAGAAAAAGYAGTGAGIAGVGVAGTMGIVGIAAAVVGVLGYLGIDYLANKSAAANKASVEGSVATYTDAVNAARGGDVSKKKSALSALEADLAKQKEEAGGFSLSGFLGISGATQEMQQKSIKLTTEAIEKLKTQIDELSRSADAGSEALRKIGGDNGSKLPMIVEK